MAVTMICNVGWSCFTPGLHSSKMLHKWNTKFLFKGVFHGRSRDFQPHPVSCIAVPLVDIGICGLYILCVQFIYISIFTVCIYLYSIYIYIYIYLFISKAVKM